MAKWIALALFALPGLEVVVFVVVAAQIGFLQALALIFACSITGVLILRHVGQSTLTRLRAEQSGGRIAMFQSEGGTLLTALGAILLVVPGFITSLFAVPLLIPPLRGWIARGVVRWTQGGARSGRFGWTVEPPPPPGAGGRGRAGDDVVDLTPGEWRQMPAEPADTPASGDNTQSLPGSEASNPPSNPWRKT